MAQIDWDRSRVLVEFGPGVGTITREALKRMRPDAVLLAIELNKDFVQYLGTTIRDPRLRVGFRLSFPASGRSRLLVTSGAAGTVDPWARQAIT